jgi:hypothetical protein
VPALANTFPKLGSFAFLGAGSTLRPMATLGVVAAGTRPPLFH